MSLELGTLTKYVNEHAMELIKEAVLKGKTVDVVKVQGGVKHSATINRIATELVAQAGACGWSATGSTTLDQRVIEVADIKINESICLNDLEDYYTNVMMNPGSYNTDIPFEQIFAQNKVDQLKSLIETLIWQGDTDSGVGNLAFADGFIKLFDAGITASSDNYGTYTAASFSGSAAIDLIDEIVATIPSNIIDQDDLVLFVGYPEYRTYAKALRDANLFHYSGTEGTDFEMMIPGTNVKMIAVKGLNGQNRIVASHASNFYVGTDLLNDAEDFKIWYSQDNDEVRFLSKFKLGTQVAFLENVVWYVGS